MRERQVPAVKFEKNEMADIISYLYFINYFDKPGDPARGITLFARKGCAQCHAVTPGTKSLGPNLSTAAGVGSPIEIIAAMWNHAQAMEPAMRAKGVPWPKFEPGEMTDVIEFIYMVRERPVTTGTGKK
jgi:cytochrome c2